MTTEKLANAIEKEKKLLAGYRKKRVELDDKIKKSEAKLHQYEMMQNSEKFNAVAALVSQSGLSMEAVISALQNGDLLALQEQMEAAQQETVEEVEPVAAADDAEGEEI